MGKIGFIVCNTYARELDHIVHSLGLKDCNIKVLPLVCSVHTINDQLLSSKDTQEFRDESSHIITMPPTGCANCGNCSKKHPGHDPSSTFICTEWLVPPRILQTLIEQHKYIVTPGWLMQWRNIVQKHWGFTGETARLFFGESAREITVLDTGVHGDYRQQLQEFSSFTGLPYNIFPIGTEYLTKQVESFYYRHLSDDYSSQITETKKELMKKLSENKMIIDILHRLGAFDSGESVVGFIFEIAKMFFAPGKLAFYSATTLSFHTPFNLTAEECARLCDFPHNFTLLPSGKGFVVKLTFGRNTLGFIIIDDILFPEFIQHYTELGETLAPLFGILLTNVNQIELINQAKRDAVIEAEKYMQMSEELGLMNTILHDREQELERLVATKDKFFSIISHDLRTPFTSLIGLSELLELKLMQKDTDTSLKYSRHINSVATQTLSMLENLLKWSKMQTGNLTSTPIKLPCNEILEDAMWLMNNVASQKNISITSNCPSNLVAFADDEMAKTIVRNLLSNAIKFTYTGGKIDINVTPRGEMILFEVRDSGTGMSDDTLSKLFNIDKDKSMIGTADEKGSGLGMILCREFVEQNKGEIWAESEVGKGSVIYFTLPAFKA